MCKWKLRTTDDNKWWQLQDLTVLVCYSEGMSIWVCIVNFSWWQYNTYLSNAKQGNAMTPFSGVVDEINAQYLIPALMGQQGWSLYKHK